MANNATRGIRGAITVEENSKDAIKEATVELLGALLKENCIDKEDISFVIFTLTKDLNAAFPALYARTECGFDLVPMMCYEELAVPGSLEQCLRIMLVVNTDKKQNEISHQYLKGAKVLRMDIK